MTWISTDEWICEEDAIRLVNRSRYTLRRWRRKNHARARRHEGDGLWYNRAALLAIRDYMQERYDTRRIVPGPGRGKWHSRDQLAFDFDQEGP